MPLQKSWVKSANAAGSPFPLNNLPYGVFSICDVTPRCGVAIGEFVLDLTALEASGAIDCKATLQGSSWNAFMALGARAWTTLRTQLTTMLREDAEDPERLKPHLYRLADVQLHMPFVVAEYTDFYASRHHATNVGTMFRGAENALPPNWLHIPIGYNGRASSVVVSGTPVRRPWGQLKAPNVPEPHFAPSARFDIELELGAVVGMASTGPISVAEADAHIFGYVLLNDWSARDIQAWEYQPLGPFQAKATATTISPWIVTAAALEPFRCATPEREVPLLPYLAEPFPTLFDIDLEVLLAPDRKTPTVLTRTNYKEMYYSSAQQLAHHTACGCAMRVGDLLGSGTISGPAPGNRGSLLELSLGGQTPIELDTGEHRSFVEDGDTVTLKGAAQGDGFSIGFGDCKATVLPALDDPYGRG